ncbi:MAG: histidine phosphatase family protein [Alphaproteobacteria bacterium]
MLIRHGATQWNLDGRIQGRADPPLAPEGRAAVSAWRLPPEMAGVPGPGDWIWLTSPLTRARETAALLNAAPDSAEPASIEPALIEMDWGTWEGRRLATLRAEGGPAMAEAEARGLDFQPPGGESPRQVQDRLRPLLERLAAAGRPAVAVTHKGVIRALYALASGWDMTGRGPGKLRDGCAQRFLLGPDGAPETDQLNLPLAP